MDAPWQECDQKWLRMESPRFEELGRGWGRGWADTAHSTELQSGFCSVVRIGRSGRGWADTAHTTEDNQRHEGGERQGQDLAAKRRKKRKKDGTV